MHVPAVRGIEAPHGAFDLRMSGVADEHHVAALARIPRHFHVHFGHQWTGGIEHRESTPFRFVFHRRGHAMRGEDDSGAVGHLVELVDEYSAELAQALDHVHVVHHFVPHVDRCAEQADGALDDVDGAIDSGAETPRIGEQDFHATRRARRPSSSESRITRTAPMVMAESATLNAGKECRPQCACTKSTT